MTMDDERINIGSSDDPIFKSKTELINYSKAFSFTTGIYIAPNCNRELKIECKIISNHNGWITAVSNENIIIQDWAGMFHIV